VDLPTLESLKGVDLDCSGTEVRLQLPGSVQYLRIEVPREITENSSSPIAKFSRKRCQLTISWDSPVVHEPVIEDNFKHVSLPDPTGVMAGSESDVDSQGAPVGEALVTGIRSDRELSWVEKVSQETGLSSDCGYNCLEELTDEVEHALKQCTVERFKNIAELRGASVILRDFCIDGSATYTNESCCIKCYLRFRWEVLDPLGGMLGATGTIEVAELTQEAAPAKVSVKVAHVSGAQARAAGDWMKRAGLSIIAECLHGQRLCAAVAAACQARSAANSGSHLTFPVPRDFGQKCMINWATAWLAQKICTLHVRLFGGLASAALSAPEVSGDASLSVCDGKPVVSFRLRVACTWVVTSSSGGSAEARGTLLAPEFASDIGTDACKFEVEVKSQKKSSGQFTTAFRITGVAALRSLLVEFGTEMQGQGR